MSTGQQSKTKLQASKRKTPGCFFCSFLSTSSERLVPFALPSTCLLCFFLVASQHAEPLHSHHQQLAPCSLISVSNTWEKEPSASSPFLYWPLQANHFPHGFVWDTRMSQLIMLINAIPLRLWLWGPLLSTQATEICPASPLHRYQPLPCPMTCDFPNPRTNWSSPYWIFLLHSIGWLPLPWQTLLEASGSLFLLCLSHLLERLVPSCSLALSPLFLCLPWWAHSVGFWQAVSRCVYPSPIFPLKFLQDIFLLS